MRGHPWSTEQIDELKRLWANKATIDDCAAGLSEKFGIAVSRNAVIGKVDRLNLTKRRKTPQRKRRVVPDASRISGDPSRSLIELENHHCRWPLWPNNTPASAHSLFCGVPEADFIAGFPYCRHHTQKALP